MNLCEEGKALYTESNKTWRKQTTKDIFNKWNDK